MVNLVKLQKLWILPSYLWITNNAVQWCPFLLNACVFLNSMPPVCKAVFFLLAHQK